MKDLKKILVIEDTPENLAVAKEYFNQLGSKDVTYATNYKEVPSVTDFDGVLTDLMFPYDSSGSLEEHRKLVKRIGDNIRQNDIGIYDSAVLHDLKKLEQSAIDGTVSGLDSGKVMIDLQYQKRMGKIKEEGEDYTNLIIETRSKKFPAEQPMGVLVAEQCKENGIPYVIVTSGHGRHGDVTTPIFQYMTNIGLRTSKFDIEIPDLKKYKEGDFKSMPSKEYFEENFGIRQDSPVWDWLEESNIITDAMKKDGGLWKFAHHVLEGKASGRF